MLAENVILPQNLIKPIFIHLKKHDIPLPLLPNSDIKSMSSLLKYIEKLSALGILGVNLYPILDAHEKDSCARESLNPKGVLPQAIKLIKEHFPECVVIPDVALDPYTTHGHDGLIDTTGNILNDESVAILMKQSVLYAEAGADYIAPSDMFDGRTLKIRYALDEAGYPYVGIIAYAAKHNSAYYSPFRTALNNNHLQGIDKSSYQIEPGNARQAMSKIIEDINGRADIVMIKPAGHYLDIVTKAKQITNKPIAVFQVSGECALIKYAAQAGIINEKRAVMEQLCSMKRAGADLIFTYYAEKLFI